MHIFQVTLSSLGQLYYCLSIREITLKDVGKINKISTKSQVENNTLQTMPIVLVICRKWCLSATDNIMESVPEYFIVESIFIPEIDKFPVHI